MNTLGDLQEASYSDIESKLLQAAELRAANQTHSRALRLPRVGLSFWCVFPHVFCATYHQQQMSTDWMFRDVLWRSGVTYWEFVEAVHRLGMFGVTAEICCVRRFVKETLSGEKLCKTKTTHSYHNIQSEHRDKNIPVLTRAPYDLRFSLVFFSFHWLSYVFLGLLRPLYLISPSLWLWPGCTLHGKQVPPRRCVCHNSSP